MEKIAYLQSHVIRRPLANILGLCGLLNDGVFVSDTEIYGAIDNILQQAQELDDVVKEIVKNANH